MSEIISKELLSKVFGQRVISCNINKNEVMIQFFGYDDIINIYELAFKCKEWARYDHFIIVSALVNNENTARAKVKYSFKKDDFLDIETNYFLSDTEPEAIFKACQWILENKDK